jgi:hypothetical protein
MHFNIIVTSKVLHKIVMFFPEETGSIPGVPGRDYPTYNRPPKTKFACVKGHGGYFADASTRCQVSCTRLSFSVMSTKPGFVALTLLGITGFCFLDELVPDYARHLTECSIVSPGVETTSFLTFIPDIISNITMWRMLLIVVN